MKSFLAVPLILATFICSGLLTKKVDASSGGSLPTDQAVVTITFDDGPRSIYDYGLPKLKKYSIPATIYLSTAYIGVPDEDWYLNWNQVKALNDSSWEIASHGYTHPDLTLLDDNAIKNELTTSKSILSGKGYNAVSFAPPYGEYDNRVLNLIKQEFQSNRRAWDDNPSNEGFNDLHSYDRYNISAKELKKNTTVSNVKNLINKVVKQKKWLVFFLHGVAKRNSTADEYSASNLEQIAKYLSQQQAAGKLQVQTVKGFLSSH